MWTIERYNDAGERLFRSMRRAVRAGMIPLGTDAWQTFTALPPGYTPPRCQTLILDAPALLPDIGPSVVLAFTALETLIDTTLDTLVRNTTIPPDLWQWIFNREQYWRQPSSAEEFDLFLRLVTGTSLKTDNPALWEVFQNLRHARNSFVHAGKARMGTSEVTVTRAAQLIEGARSIIDWIEPRLPLTFQRPHAAAEYPNEQFAVEIPILEVPDAPSPPQEEPPTEK